MEGAAVLDRMRKNRDGVEEELKSNKSMSGNKL